MHVLPLVLQKGGTGKTTTTASLGAELGKRGARVLLIDIDPQANLTKGLGINLKDIENSIYEVLLNPELGVSFATIFHVAGMDNVDLVPSVLALAGAENELAGKIGRELLLKRAIGEVKDQYDYILIDPPPSLGIFTLNALAAGTSVIVPMQTHVYAYDALPQLEKTIDLMKQLNPSLAIGGVVCTLYDSRTNVDQAIVSKVREKYGELVFKTMIPDNTKLSETPATGLPITLYAPKSPGAKAYAELAEEVEARYGRQR